MNRLGSWFLDALPRERLSREVGRLASARRPRWLLELVLAAYVRAYRVTLDEAEIPPGGFGSFEEFFVRRLLPGSRPIEGDEDSVVSPADGRLADFGPVDGSTRFRVKGQSYDAVELLGSAADARAFTGGSHAVVYLSPRDYHRVHAPIGGEVDQVRHLPGRLYPVNAFGVRHVSGLLARNERVVVRLRTEGDAPVAVVLVGALIVGRVTLTFPAPERPGVDGPARERSYPLDGRPRLERGTEMGAFRLGSTVVVLMPPGFEPGGSVPGGSIRVGQVIARRRGQP